MLVHGLISRGYCPGYAMLPRFNAPYQSKLEGALTDTLFTQSVGMLPSYMHSQKRSNTPSASGY